MEADEQFSHLMGVEKFYPHAKGIPRLRKPKSYTLTSREPTNSPQMLWKPRNSAHPPWESHTSGKPRSYTLTSWEPSNFTSTPGKPQNSTHLSVKPRSVPDLIPLKTPTKERDQQKVDSASIQEIRHPSKRRNSRDNSEMHQEEHIHQEKNADQTRKAKARLHVMFEKEYHNNRCIEESIGIPATVKGKGLGKRRKLSLVSIPIDMLYMWKVCDRCTL
ncbi:uncharacterized protein LOC119570467 [Penaeus monodon]|uniref:uncharacterized protein LOC119570467 n=1 Tax=Penaeus monodon TaxID=6687 RepID=UPI0018A6DB62|nr:uncharacterized protein LOC119570467 [Penaeus monodon]